MPTHQHRRVALVRLARHVTERPRARGHLARLCIRSAARRRSPSRRNCYARHRQSITRRPAGGPPWPARRTAPPHPRVRARTTAAHCIGSTRADSLRFCQNFQNQWVALGRRGRRACPRLQSLSPRASPASCTGSSQVRQQAHWSGASLDRVARARAPVTTAFQCIGAAVTRRRSRRPHGRAAKHVDEVVTGDGPQLAAHVRVTQRRAEGLAAGAHAGEPSGVLTAVAKRREAARQG